MEHLLSEWFSKMINAYSWLTIKYEYNEERNLFLVSFSPKEAINKNEGLCAEILDFEDKMNALYGDGAPLFCDDEEYFHLSDKATTMGYQPVAYKEILCDNATKVNWILSSDYQKEISNRNYYTLAA